MKGFLFAFLLLPVLVVIYARYIEKRTLFYPDKRVEFNPLEIGLAFEDVFFKSADALTLNGWFIQAKEARPTIIFCHGNAGNISHRLDKIRFFNRLSYNVFIFDYRGYGKSKGSPSEKGLYTDAQSAYLYLLSRGLVPRQIIGYGESLGGAVIIDLASENTLRALIIEDSFSSGKDMARRVYPFLPYWVFSSRFDSAGKMKSVSAPTLIIHSRNDEIVPFELGYKLYEASGTVAEFLEIHGGHNTAFFESEEFLEEKIAAFLDKIAD